MKDELIELQLIALSPSAAQEGQFVVVLSTLDEQRRLPILIAKSEAQAIAIAVEQLQPARPLAYDSWLATLKAGGIQLRQIVIERVEDSVFYARLGVEDTAKNTHAIDIRPSDALALAARSHTRIFTTEKVLQVASFRQSELEKLPKKGSLVNYSLAELETLLERLLAKEDYQSAARIRDLIKQRKL